MTLEYRAVLDIDGACEAVRESVDCPSCKGEKKTIFEKVCRSCEGTGKVWRIILVNEVSRRTD